MMNADRITGSRADVREIMITCEENVVGFFATYTTPKVKVPPMRVMSLNAKSKSFH